MPEHSFGLERDWPDQDLIGFSTEFNASLTLAAYRSGVFPMPLAQLGGDMGWWSPVRRGVLPLSKLKISRSLRKSAARYTTTIDVAFSQVIRRCADPSRDGGWIDQRVRRVFSQLHDAGHVHSVEVWDDEQRLVGGLYGVSIGGLFAGESMFHDPDYGTDASKVALIRLVEELGRTNSLSGEFGGSHDRLLDVQWVTDHLAHLGAVDIDRVDYLRRLDRVVEAEPVAWPVAGESGRRGCDSVTTVRQRQSLTSESSHHA